MQPRRLLAAERLAGPRVGRRFDDEGRGRSPSEPVGQNRDVLPARRLGFGALDGIAPQPGDATDVHARIRAAGARTLSPRAQHGIAPVGRGRVARPRGDDLRPALRTDRGGAGGGRRAADRVRGVCLAPVRPHVLRHGTVFSSAGDPAARAAAQAAQGRQPGRPPHRACSCVSICVRLLEWSAIVTVVANAYAGAPTTIAQAYAVGLRRWPQQLLIALVFVALGIIAAIPLLIRYVIVIFAVIALAALQVTRRNGRDRRDRRADPDRRIRGGRELGLHDLRARGGGGGHRDAQRHRCHRRGAAARRGPRDAPPYPIVGGLSSYWSAGGGVAASIGIAAVALILLTHRRAVLNHPRRRQRAARKRLIAAFVVVYAVDVRVRREGIDMVAEPPPAVRMSAPLGSR